MRRRLLTLAIAYSVAHQNYQVICYDPMKLKIIPLELSEADIQGDEGIYFDIGAITEVEELVEDEINYPIGKSRIVERWSRAELKKLLELQSVNIEYFYNNDIVDQYSVIKVSKLRELVVTKVRCIGVVPKVSFFSEGCKKENIYINDYRWLKYVQHLESTQQNLKETLNEYQEFLSSGEKEIYFIMNKICKKETGKVQAYIAGIHYL